MPPDLPRPPSPLASPAADAGFTLAGRAVPLGCSVDLSLPLAETYSGASVSIPIRIVRGDNPGPALFITGAVHGDEINGAGIVREIILAEPFKLRAGTLVLVPVVNLFGFERRERTLPDRRDLNRCFPGNAAGSLATRFAHVLFTEIVRRCDYGIDLHTAAAGRTNFPNVRADLSRPDVRRIAVAFGCELIVAGRGPAGSLRRAACNAGCPTIILEAGEVAKVEPTVVEAGVRGVRNVLAELGMIDGRPYKPAYQLLIDKTTWVRAKTGGMLQFHVAPGDLVQQGQPIATIADILGRNPGVIESPRDGVILGMATLPAVNPGDPICHIAVVKGGLGPVRKAIRGINEHHLHERLRGDLATNVTVTERPG
jgi:predicted deacylase